MLDKLSKFLDSFKAKRTTIEVRHKNAPPPPLPPTDDSGVMSDQNWSFTEFKGLSSSGPLEVHWEASSTYSITAKGDSIQMAKVTVQCEKGVLSFSAPDFISRTPLKITIKSPNIQHALNQSGSQMVLESIKGDTFKAEQQGKGSLFVAGSVGTAEIIADMGSLDASQLRASIVNARGSNGAQIECFASAAAMADANTRSFIQIHGDPAHPEASTHDGGRVKVFGAKKLSWDSPEGGIFDKMPLPRQ